MSLVLPTSSSTKFNIKLDTAKIVDELIEIGAVTDDPENDTFWIDGIKLTDYLEQKFEDNNIKVRRNIHSLSDMVVLFDLTNLIKIQKICGNSTSTGL